jgi:hypothetical protein
MKKLILPVSLLAAFFLLPNVSVLAQTPPTAGSSIFWGQLQKLCGKAFSGTIAAAPEDDTAFKGKALVMHVRSCEKDRIRISFFVEDDKSRTWVLTKKEDRILLKHDHRHTDGTPAKITQYGGWTTNSGSPTRQMFPADQETVDLLPAAAASVWWIDLVPGDSFTYSLRQLGTDMYYRVRFNLSKEVSKPGAAWGWRD